jgi:hypothetical protein
LSILNIHYFLKNNGSKPEGREEVPGEEQGLEGGKIVMSNSAEIIPFGCI